MDKIKAEKIVTEYIKPIFHFALKRCKNEKDAEDLSQEIALKAFCIFIVRNDIYNYEKFIWTIVHNTLANYYRDTSRNIGVSIENFQEKIKFEEVATIRPDGAHDIANVTIQSNKEKNRKYYSSLLKWCGPSWTSYNNRMLWCCRSEWTAEKSMQEFWDYVSPRSITLLCRLHNEELLSVDEYTFLAQQGFIKMEDKTPVSQIVWLKDKEIKDKLLEIGKKIV